MLPILSTIKYEMIQVEKMQMEIEKWMGSAAEEPETRNLSPALAEPWGLLATIC